MRVRRRWLTDKLKVLSVRNVAEALFERCVLVQLLKANYRAEDNVDPDEQPRFFSRREFVHKVSALISPTQTPIDYEKIDRHSTLVFVLVVSLLHFQFVHFALNISLLCR